MRSTIASGRDSISALIRITYQPAAYLVTGQRIGVNDNAWLTMPVSAHDLHGSNRIEPFRA